MARLTADLPTNVPQLPAPRVAAFAVAQDTEDGPPAAAALGPGAGGPGAAPGTVLEPLTPVKFIATVAAADNAPPGSTSTTTGSSDAPDPGVLGVDFTQARPGAEPAAATPAMQTAVGNSGWAEELGSHVIWMAQQGVSTASLRLQPEHLGPLEVKISVHDATASVWFGANEPETRTALQAALPQLKEMFAAQGMTLTDAGVSRESPREQPLPRTAPPASGVSAQAAPEGVSMALSLRRGLIDTYA
jgi:flagellar hook-length control protein FliK